MEGPTRARLLCDREDGFAPCRPWYQVPDVTHLLGPWGLLPSSCPSSGSWRRGSGALAFGGTTARVGDRAVAGVVLAFAATVHSAVRVLSCVHADATGPLVSALAVAAAVLAVAGRRTRFVWPTVPWLSRSSPSAVVFVAVFALAVTAARWLPVWQWDAVRCRSSFHPGGARRRRCPCRPRVHRQLPARRRASLRRPARVPPRRPARRPRAGAVRARWRHRHGGSRGGSAHRCTSRSRRVRRGSRSPRCFSSSPRLRGRRQREFLLAALYFVLAPPTLHSVILAGIAIGLFVGENQGAAPGRSPPRPPHRSRRPCERDARARPCRALRPAPRRRVVRRERRLPREPNLAGDGRCGPPICRGSTP